MCGVGTLPEILVGSSSCGGAADKVTASTQWLPCFAKEEHSVAWAEVQLQINHAEGYKLLASQAFSQLDLGYA